MLPALGSLPGFIIPSQSVVTSHSVTFSESIWHWLGTPIGISLKVRGDPVSAFMRETAY